MIIKINIIFIVINALLKILYYQLLLIKQTAIQKGKCLHSILVIIYMKSQTITVDILELLNS